MSNKKGVVLKNILIKLKNDNLSKLILSALILVFILNMILSPAKFIEQGLNGITAWAMNVLPSVLPFMFFTKALSSLGQMEKLTRPFQRITRKLYNTPPISFYTFFMAILSGYPVGSKMIADLYLQGKITKDEAFRMSAFSSTSGPMFIIGAVGVSMFKSSQIGYILFISHAAGALINGLIYRNLGRKVNKRKKGQIDSIIKETNLSDKTESITLNNKENINVVNKSQHGNNIEAQIDSEEKFNRNKKEELTENLKNDNKDENLEKDVQGSENAEKQDISDIVLSSTLAILSVGCIITIFFIIIECLSPIFHLFPESVAATLEGIVEITKGCISLSSLSNIKLSVILASFVISFGGISTIIQSLTMLKKVEMPVKLFALQKFTHAIISCIITILLVLIFM